MTTKIQPLLTWRGAIAGSDLAPTTRHVALTLSLWMGDLGDSAFPGPTKLSKATGLSLRTVKEHLGLLVEKGWLTITERGGIKGEKRKANVYASSIPTRAGAAPVQKKTRAAKAPVQVATATRASDDATPVQELHPNSSGELSKELSIPEKPAALEKTSGKSPAHLIAERHWNETRPRPVLRGKFPALRSMIETLLDAGHDEEHILRALSETKAYTLDAIQFSLREGNNAGKANGHQRTMDTLRKMAVAK